MNYEERKWINRRVFYHKDNLFNSGGELSLDISTSTEDGINFSIPKINLRVRSLDNRVRNFGLDLNEITALICSLVEANIQNEEFVCSAGKEIIRKGYNLSLVIQPFISASNDRIVIISIVHNESDQGKIIIPFQSFKCICNIFNMFKSEYWKIYTDLQNDYKFSQISENIISLKNSIHILPSLINDNIEDKPQQVIDSVVSEFSEFLDEKEKDIKIPELENDEEKSIIQEVESKFINEILKCNIDNFASIMTTISTTENPLEGFISSVKDLNLSEFTPGLSDIERKSLIFLSKVAFKTTFKNYLENGKPIDSNFSIMRYDTESFTDENVEFAYDLFMIMAYIQTARERLESKITDGQVNKSILYAATRCFLDPLIFSFLMTKTPEVIKNCITTRYNYFLSKGFFNSIDNIIEENQCSKITSSDIALLIDKVCNVLGKTKSIKELHMDSFNSGMVSIPYENEFTQEQMINEIIDLQVDKRLGRELITSNEDLKKIFLTKEKKETKVKEENKKKSAPKYNSNIHRFVSNVDFIKQIPEKFKNEFIEHIKNLKDNFDFSSKDFPIEELGEDIVKGLYLWNDSDNKKEAYTNFRVRHENCLSKDNIISKVKSEVEIDDDGTDFNFDTMGFSSMSNEL